MNLQELKINFKKYHKDKYLGAHTTPEKKRILRKYPQAKILENLDKEFSIFLKDLSGDITIETAYDKFFIKLRKMNKQNFISALKDN